MSILKLTSDTLVGSPVAGQIEYDGQFYGTDSNLARAQLQRLVLATAQNSTSGTSIDFTGIPAWVKRITVTGKGFSTNGTSGVLVRLGDSGGFGSTTYTSLSVTPGGTTTNNTTGLQLTGTSAAASVYDSVLIINFLASNTYVATGTTGTTSGGWWLNGSATLTGTLTQLRIITTNGTDTFDAGTINVLYEG